MVFTRIHYNMIAEILKKNKASVEMVKEFADFFALENERFNFLQFMEAATGDRYI